MTDLERIDKLLKWLVFDGFAANNMEIAEKLGYTKSSFSQIIHGKVPLSDKFIDKLASVNQNINKLWIISGTGSMLLNDSEDTLKENYSLKASGYLIPLIPISAEGGSLNQFFCGVKEFDCEWIVSPIKGTDFAITVSGESMAPEFTNGSKILIKKINERAFIEWGKVYVLDTCNGTVIKIIVPSENEGNLRCLSINTDPRYAPFEISQLDIFGIYRVILGMSLK
jgi:phage repressor protein C with HTH and peptisase S24 domain